MRLKIEYVDPSELVPYSGNAKLHPAEQIEQIKESINEFGFNDPIAVWQGNEIIEGHGRLIAALELGLKKVPVVRLDSLTDEQRRAYTLVHNKLTMNSDFDVDLLANELQDLPELDMSKFGFDADAFEDVDADDFDDIDPRAASMRRNVFENQTKARFRIENWYGIPTMDPSNTSGDQLLRFCDYNQVTDHENYIAHFYYDDYKFINAWREPDRYIDRLKKFKAVIAPDFSLYTDFPRALQILSCYRRQWCARYWQDNGIDVIPDVVWGDEESYEFCFLGIPKGSVVAVSTVGVALDDEWNGIDDDLFKKGYNEMLKRLEPTAVIFYGSEIEGLEGNIIRVPSFYEERRGMLDEREYE